MKTSLRSNLVLATLFALLSVSLISTAGAQGVSPSANATRFGIAVVDVSYIFENYSQFKGAMDSIKADIQAAESKLKSDGQGIKAKEEQLRTFQPNSPEFKRLDEEVARMKADFNIKAARTRKDFQEREAKVYYQTYMQVSGIVQQYAQQNNIGLVLRFNGDQINPENPKAILGAINKFVVAQNNVDITPDILALLNRGGAQAQRPGQPRR